MLPKQRKTETNLIHSILPTPTSKKSLNASSFNCKNSPTWISRCSKSNESKRPKMPRWESVTQARIQRVVAIKMERRSNHNKKMMEVKNLSMLLISNLKSVEIRTKRNLKLAVATTTKVDVLTTMESKTKTKKATISQAKEKKRRIQMLLQTWA